MLALVPCLAIPAKTQTAKLLKAQQHMEALQYADAQRIYERLYRKDETNQTALVGLAETYRRQGQLDEAAAWFSKATQQESAEAFVFYRYGQILFQLRGCEAAQPIFNRYLLMMPYAEDREVLRDVCAYREQLTAVESQLTTVTQPDFNGPGSDIAPAFYQEGLLFGSVRQEDEKALPAYDLYFTQPTTNGRLDQAITYSEAERFSDKLNTEVNEAIVTFSPDGQEVYFTRNQTQMVSEKNPIRRLEIIVSKKGEDGTWSIPEPLPFNSLDYNTAHPALTPDGSRLFFASDRPGGFGGKDIYYVDRIGDIWSSPINLGPAANTTGDELYPHYHADGVLYFASEGHLGLGGLDVFRTEDVGDGLWGPVSNLGTPINSSADDFAFIHHPTDDYGFFTSNRAGGAGQDDIYAFQQQRVQ
ncbi:MAG: tetratricopeptide repeat protein, partial [Bacteroidota bacterium]